MISETINQAKNLFENGKFEKSLILLDKVRDLEDLKDSEKLSYNLLKSSLFFRFRRDEECLRYAEIAYQQAQNLNHKMLSIDALLNKSWALFWFGDFEQANISIRTAEKILNNLKNISDCDYKRRKALIYFIKACRSWFLSDSEGLKYANKSLKIRQRIGRKYEIVESYSILSGLITHFTDDFDNALEFLRRCHKLGLEIHHPWTETFDQKNFGDIYYIKGDLHRALKHYKRGIKIFEENNNLNPILSTLSEIGNVYREMGDLTECCNYLIYSYDISKKTQNDWLNSEIITNIIEILVLRGNIKKAEVYLKKLEGIYKMHPNNKRFEHSYLIAKALTLKFNPRIKSQAQAQEIFTTIIEDQTLKNEYLITALLNQCELLLQELVLTNRDEIIEEINPLIEILLKKTKNLRSYWLLSETLVLQAKIALLTFKLIKARKLLTKAQFIAEENGLNRLSVKISHEHDELLQKFKKWEQLKDSESPISERIKLTNLSEQISNLVQKRRISISKIVEESPIMILIFSEGGNPVYSQVFAEENSFKFHLFGGLLTTLDYFIKELFSEGLDRAIFGKYTLLINKRSPFIIVYIFKGKSYLALHRIKHFCKTIRDEGSIWENLIDRYRQNKLIHQNDLPLLDLMISKIFIEKVLS